MKLNKVRLFKELTIQVKDFHPLKTGVDITFDVDKGEEFDFPRAWDIINQELNIETDLDPSWIKTEVLKDFYKTTIKFPKRRI